MVYSFGNYYHIYLLLKRRGPKGHFHHGRLEFSIKARKESPSLFSHLVQEWHSVRRKMTTYPSPLWMTKYPNILHTYVHTFKYTMGSIPFWSKFFHLPRLHAIFTRISDSIKESLEWISRYEFLIVLEF